ncbi:hypothetical protein ABZ916_39685 [Streptomyces sp. NPDC046853]|uniref:hypothetical protein n=1 Tax=Streptomyces sp. NPDC046853 TaxID=3154920 RepID=UPI0033D8B9F2
MGVRLIVEILDHWQDVGLTPGERGDLIVLAENANDGSRETWGAVHADHILKRAGKAAPSWRISINRLMKKKVLAFAERNGKELRGYTGQHAVYRLVELCPDPPHSGYKGHCTKPEKGLHSVESADQEEGYPSANPVEQDPEEGYLTANPEGYQPANAVDGLGYLTATERVSSQLTPTPLVPSFDLSSKDSPSSSVAEAPEEGDLSGTEVTEGGGGGNLSLEEITEQAERAERFVDSLDFRNKQPGKQQRLKMCQRVAAAFKAGWTEKGLRRYLDISDDPNVRSAAAVYVHRLSEDELPPVAEEVDLRPPCSWCRIAFPTAATDGSVRKTPLGDPCPDCHPSVMKTAELPPVCETCLATNAAAEFNVTFRRDYMSFKGGLCPRCHPAMLNGDQSDGGLWERAAQRARQRDANGSWKGAGTDERVAGWMNLSRQLADSNEREFAPRPMIAPPHQPYRDPDDQSVYDEPFPGTETQ